MENKDLELHILNTQITETFFFFLGTYIFINLILFYLRNRLIFIR